MPRNTLRCMVRSTAGALALAASLQVEPASAQIVSASPAALGVGENFTARARGYHAVAWNPAGLGLDGNPAFSLSLLSARLILGLDPVTTTDLFVDYADKVVPKDVREEWLQRITDAGSETGSFGGDGAVLAVNLGRLGFQASATVRGAVDLGPDGAELLLFGNAGRTGVARPLNAKGSGVDGFATSTFAFSLGIPIGGSEAENESFALGFTGKYIVGNAVLLARDVGTTVSSDPLKIDMTFPVVLTSSDAGPSDSGSGFGIDLGAAWQGPTWTVAGVIKNVVNTFEWDEASLAYLPGTTFFDKDTTYSDFDEQPFAQAPTTLKDELADMTYKPAIAVGVAFRPGSMLTLSGDFRQQLGDGLSLEPKSHVGAGVELRLLPILPLRGGFAVVTGGTLLSAGTGLELGLLNINAAAASRGGDVLGMVGISFGGRPR